MFSLRTIRFWIFLFVLVVALPNTAYSQSSPSDGNYNPPSDNGSAVNPIYFLPEDLVDAEKALEDLIRLKDEINKDIGPIFKIDMPGKGKPPDSKFTIITDKNSLPVKIIHQNGRSVEYEYTYDKKGNITSVTLTFKKDGEPKLLVKIFRNSIIIELSQLSQGDPDPSGGGVPPDPEDGGPTISPGSGSIQMIITPETPISLDKKSLIRYGINIDAIGNALLELKDKIDDDEYSAKTKKSVNTLKESGQGSDNKTYSESSNDKGYREAYIYRAVNECYYHIARTLLNDKKLSTIQVKGDNLNIVIKLPKRRK